MIRLTNHIKNNMHFAVHHTHYHIYLSYFQPRHPTGTLYLVRLFTNVKVAVLCLTTVFPRQIHQVKFFDKNSPFKNLGCGHKLNNTNYT